MAAVGVTLAPDAGDVARSTSARIAGFTLLFYIVIGLSGMVLSGGPARLAILGQQASALTLAVTLFLITRREGPVIAVVGMLCRVLEGVGGTVAGWLNIGWSVATSATFFAVGSTCFAVLLLRGRNIPTSLAWIGVVASVLLVVCLPLQLGGLLKGPVTLIVWLPMLVFEVTLALWFLAKGVRPAQ